MEFMKTTLWETIFKSREQSSCSTPSLISSTFNVSNVTVSYFRSELPLFPSALLFYLEVADDILPSEKIRKESLLC